MVEILLAIVVVIFIILVSLLNILLLEDRRLKKYIKNHY